MATPVEQIKERLDIVDVLSSYITLTRAGINLKARCPFHNEKTPSFFVSPERQGYYCFGCGAKGDMFNFVEQFEGLDFVGALKVLADRAGVILTKESRDAHDAKDPLYNVMEEATVFFEQELKKEKNAQLYLRDRGLSQKTIDSFRLGFVKNDWRTLYDHLKSKGYADQVIEAVGLAKRADGRIYDRFRGRIMFPIFDSSGRVIAFSGRLFIDDGKSAKYLNSPETPLFDKSSVLYGIDRAKNSIRMKNYSILVEGQFDLILAHQSGFTNTVASSGTALADEVMTKESAVTNLGMLRRLSNNIVLAYDGDEAGIKATLRAAKIALSLGMDVKVAPMPAGLDPADIMKDNPKNFGEALKAGTHVINFTLDNIKKQITDPRLLGRAIRTEILPLVANLESAVEQAHFIHFLSEKTGIPESAIERDLRAVAIEQKEESGVSMTSVEIPKDRSELVLEKIFGFIFLATAKQDKDIDVIKIENTLKSILGDEEYAVRFNLYDKQKNELIFIAEEYAQKVSIEKEINELLYNFEYDYFSEKQRLLSRQLKAASDSETEVQLLSAYTDITKHLEELKGKRQDT